MPDEIETWARQVIAASERGDHFEDGLVELKSNWPASHFEAARQLAAQANAVAGNALLWLIGVKQGKGVVGAAPQDLARWWPQVRRHFDKVAPRLVADRILDYPTGTAVALMFDPAEPPYVIVYRRGESPLKRDITREVPWREGTAMRTADHDDLIRLLSPAALVPEITAVIGRTNVLRAQERPADDGTPRLSWYMAMRILVRPRSSQPVVFTASDPPTARLSLLEREIVLRPFPHAFRDTVGGLVEVSGTEVIFRGAGSLEMISVGGETEVFGRQPDELTLKFSWKPVGAPHPAQTEIRLRRAVTSSNVFWDLWDMLLGEGDGP
jgi:hypothetical protein